ncbi:hypothetical protein [Halobacteriovorax sp. JY17]|nr:hypothetical protein [Halobacteriovorax sp. JY17]
MNFLATLYHYILELCTYILLTLDKRDEEFCLLIESGDPNSFSIIAAE